MKKIIKRTLCLILCLFMIPVVFVSCGTESVYTLGPYEITGDAYTYLLGMYKRRLLVELGYDGRNIDAEIATGVTVGDYIDNMYRAEFELGVYSLLYSQALFDEYGLTLSEEQINGIETLIQRTVNYYGGYSEQAFKKILKPYGYTVDTMRTVYTMQAKESAVMEHLYGKNYEKLTEIDKENYYSEKYLHFQVIVINNVYKSVTDSDGNTTYINLNESETEEKNRIIEELTELLINGNRDYNYVMICSDLNMTREQLFEDIDKTYDALFEIYSDDTLYKQGYYMLAPSEGQLTTSNALSAAYLLKTGDCAVVTARRYFQNEGTIEIGGKTETINAGDYFEYGKSFVKKLELDSGAYEREENEDFFEKDEFDFDAARNSYFLLLQKYEDECYYTLNMSSLANSYTISGAMANDLDYNFLYPSAES